MSILKSELKQQVTHEIGVGVEDSLEAARRDVHILDGRAGGLGEAAKMVEAIMGLVDKDVEAAKFDLTTAQLIKQYLSRAALQLQQASVLASNNKFGAMGRTQGLEQMVKMLSGIIESEKLKVARLQELEAAQKAAAEAGVPPEAQRFASIKEQRLAEAMTVPEEAPEEDEPKRRGRKPRARNA